MYRKPPRYLQDILEKGQNARRRGLSWMLTLELLRVLRLEFLGSEERRDDSIVGAMSLPVTSGVRCSGEGKPPYTRA